MATNPKPSSPHGNRPPANHHVSNPSLLLEKAKAGIRRSTPDSEALASSDDEPEQRQQHPAVTSHPLLNKSTGRRTSWLGETGQTPQRKASLGGGPFSPSSPGQMASPSEQGPWGSTSATMGPQAGRGHSSSTSFPWGSTIWNNDNQKALPSRFAEVMSSPTTARPGSSGGLAADDSLISPPIESAIPFAIPLHPTPKTYRSQSYSVGQLDPETNGGYVDNANQSAALRGRMRMGPQYSGLQHRPSRPSMLGDAVYDSSNLGQVQEVDDDEDSLAGSVISGMPVQSLQTQTMEQLAMENAILRQQAAERQIGTSSTSPIGTRFNSAFGQLRAEGFGDDGIYQQSAYDAEDVGQSPSTYNSTGRRFSDFNTAQSPLYSLAGIPENRKLESVKKGHWQSSLGFGGLGEIPQSRRHSFADVPTRHNSLSSGSEGPHSLLQNTLTRDDIPAVLGYGEGSSSAHRPAQAESSECHSISSASKSLAAFPTVFQEQMIELEHLRDRQYAASYFSRNDPTTRYADNNPREHSPLSFQHPYASDTPFARSHLSNFGPSFEQTLCVVTFKALRAEVYYLQEANGLSIKPGDLVIVEADRGTDLGTVQYHDVTWAQAKSYKEDLTEQHYKWLMMFSRAQRGVGTTPSTSGPNATVPAAPSVQSATGGMGPPGHPGPNDPQVTDLKPKMIKRLAQSHEIGTLKEKEGNEAKAKRVCQQKVAEHRLNMEILDAEFQMDWKKLTFYYFADAYINFNSLVTDLFKIYKTRIWMSAINPASFVAPSMGLSNQATGAHPIERERIRDTRYRQENVPFNNSALLQSAYDSPHQSQQHQWAGLDVASAQTQAHQAQVQPGQHPYGQYYASRYESQPPNAVGGLSDYSAASLQQQANRTTSPFVQQAPTSFGARQAMYANQMYKNANPAAQLYANGADWQGSLQSLSLGS
ncbi:hypothetical protein MMC25_007068 [Agyrium rufum]|nr:hypothetical protein [Agyrium rufum]